MGQSLETINREQYFIRKRLVALWILICTFLVVPAGDFESMLAFTLQRCIRQYTQECVGHSTMGYEHYRNAASNPQRTLHTLQLAEDNGETIIMRSFSKL